MLDIYWYDGEEYCWVYEDLRDRWESPAPFTTGEPYDGPHRYPAVIGLAKLFEDELTYQEEYPGVVPAARIRWRITRRW